MMDICMHRNIDLFSIYLKLEVFYKSFQKAAEKVYFSSVCKLPEFLLCKKTNWKEPPQKSGLLLIYDNFFNTFFFMGLCKKMCHIIFFFFSLCLLTVYCLWNLLVFFCVYLWPSWDCLPQIWRAGKIGLGRTILL